MKKPIVIQLSIPFCVRRCSFCGYAHCAYDAGTVRAYAEALQREIASYEGEMDDYEVQAVSVEGGSPVLLGADALYEVLSKLKRTFCCSPQLQISLQTMPGDYSRVLMERMRDVGVNFYTIGLQTAQTKEHNLLQRPYRFDAVTMVDTAIRTFDPQVLSFDLLAGIPGQTLQTFEKTLEKCLYYAPEHMTVYPLEIPAGSTLEKRIRTGEVTPMENGQREELLQFAETYLREAGFERYTLYDYAKNSRQGKNSTQELNSRQGKNSGQELNSRQENHSTKNRVKLHILQGGEYLGLGYHSSSFLDGVMWSTGHSLQEYLEHADDFETTANGMVRPDEQSLAAIRAKYSRMLNGQNQN